MLTALEPKAFRDKVRQRVRWEGTVRNPYEIMHIADEVEERYVQHEAVEAVFKETARNTK